MINVQSHFGLVDPRQSHENKQRLINFVILSQTKLCPGHTITDLTQD